VWKSLTIGAHASSHEVSGTDEVEVAQSQVTGLSTSLAGKAPISSPTFTGTVTTTSKTNFGSTSSYIHDALDANWGLLYKPSQNGTIGAHGFLNAAGSNLARIDSSGNIVATGNVTAYSDERLKSNIKTIENALEKVSQLRGVSFEKNGENEIGVIAQEVQEVLPQIVREKGDGYLGVDYEKIVALLIEGVKYQQGEIEELKIEIIKLNQIINK
jgi:polygalacturonase